MANPKPISFEQFLEEEQARTDSFRRWWKRRHDTAPEQFPLQMWPGDWNEQLHIFDVAEMDVPPPDKDTWAGIVNGWRRKIDFRAKYNTVFEITEYPGQNVDHFFQSCLIALSTGNEAGAAQFVEILNAHTPKRNSSPEEIHRQWNHPKHPIRNFLIIRLIDFPEPNPDS